jgi:hypothetical protein
MSQDFLASNYLLLVNQDEMSPVKKYEEQEHALMMMISSLDYELASLRTKYFKGLLQLGTAARDFLFYNKAFEAASPSRASSFEKAFLDAFNGPQSSVAFQLQLARLAQLGFCGAKSI